MIAIARRTRMAITSIIHIFVEGIIECPVFEFAKTKTIEFFFRNESKNVFRYTIMN